MSVTRPVGPENLFFEQLLTRYPERCATVTPDGQRVSYERFFASIKSFTAKLRSLGIGRGTVVAPFHENPSLFLALAYALLRTGATVACVPSPDRATADGLLIQFAITLPDRPARSVSNLVFDQSWFSSTGDGAAGSDGALIFTSSGTTGNTKYYLCQPSLVKSWHGVRTSFFGSEPRDKLSLLPVFSGFGLYLAMDSAVKGGGIFWPKASPAETLASIQDEAPLDLWCTPSSLSDLVVAAKANPGMPRPVARIVLGGSPLTKSLAKDAEDVFGCEVHNTYGSTEYGPHSAIRVVHSALPLGHVGKPMPQMSFDVVDEFGVNVTEGEEGRVLVGGPPQSRMTKILIGDEAFDQQGRFISGDLGYRTPDGDLVLTGRVAELINSSGSKVAPSRYEEMASRLVAAGQIAAFGIPNALGSEDVGLAIVSNQPIDCAGLSAKMQSLVGDHLKFKVFQVSELPVNPTGKVDRAALQKRLAN